MALPTPAPVELGLDTFGDVTRGPAGRPLPDAQVIRDVVEEAVLADQLGVDFIGLGEHHRADFAVSSPEMVLAAIAGRTSPHEVVRPPSARMIARAAKPSAWASWASSNWMPRPASPSTTPISR